MKRKEVLKSKGLSTPISEPRWKKRDGISCLSLTSSGVFGAKWVNALTKNTIISTEAYSFLMRKKLKVREKETHEFAFMDSFAFFQQDRNVASAKKYAHDIGLTLASAELFPLLVELLSYHHDSLSRPSKVILVHEELFDSNRDPMLLCIELQEDSIRIGHLANLDENKLFSSKVYFVFAANCDE